MKILLAVDGSEQSAKAVDVIGSHTWPAGSEIRVLTVVDQVVTATPEVAVFSPETIGAHHAQFLRTADELTTRFANWLCSSGLDAEKLVRTGDPKSVIVEEAEAWGAGMVCHADRCPRVPVRQPPPFALQPPGSTGPGRRT